MSLVTIAEYADRLSADLARLKLFGEGIDAHIMDGGMASLGLGFMTPARLMVLQEDEKTARAILARISSDDAGNNDATTAKDPPKDPKDIWS